MGLDYADIVQAELIAHNITLCAGCENYNSHTRGFAQPDNRSIHYNAKMRTRKTLHGFLHEVGHVISNHGKDCKLKRFEKESQAEQYARESLRAYGIAVPRGAVSLGNAYVKRWKQFGKKVSRGRKRVWTNPHLITSSPAKENV